MSVKILLTVVQSFKRKEFIDIIKESLLKKIADSYDSLEKNVINPWRFHSINRIKSELRDVTVKFMPAGAHVSFIFLSKDSLIKSINSFLLKD